MEARRRRHSRLDQRLHLWPLICLLAELGELAYSETDGNPRLIEELLRALVDRGALKRRPGRWLLTLPEEMEPPLLEAGASNGALLGGLSHLDGSVRLLLEGASIFGRDGFTPAGLCTLLSLEMGSVTTGLSEAHRRGIVRRGSARDGTRYTFSQTGVREALYGAIDGGDQQRLHQAAACILESELVCGRTGIEDVICQHYAACGQPARALGFGIRAIRWYEAVLIPSRALITCRFLLERVAPSSSRPAMVCHLQIRKGDLLTARGRFEEARQAYIAAEDVVSQLATLRQEGRVLGRSRPC